MKNIIKSLVITMLVVGSMACTKEEMTPKAQLIRAELSEIRLNIRDVDLNIGGDIIISSSLRNSWDTDVGTFLECTLYDNFIELMLYTWEDMHWGTIKVEVFYEDILYYTIDKELLTLNI